MKLTPEQLTECAKAVLKAYHVHPSVSNAFRKGSKNHRLFYSERASKSFPAILYWLDNNESYVAHAMMAGRTLKGMPIHAILTHTEVGDLLDVIVVPEDGAECAQFLEDAKQGLFRSYCVNLDESHLRTSYEIGYIKVKPSMGGLERIG